MTADEFATLQAEIAGTFCEADRRKFAEHFIAQAAVKLPLPIALATDEVIEWLKKEVGA
jgi:hypothetical protein